MPTLIDSLVVSLSLDPKGFTKGQKETVESLRKTEEEASKSTKGIEASGRHAAESMAGLRREIIGVGLALLGATGIKDFIQNTIKAGDTTARFARTVEMAPKTLNQWTAAAELAGSSAEDMQAAISGLQSEWTRFNLNPSESSPMFDAFRALQRFDPGIFTQRLKSGALDMDFTMKRISETLKKMPAAQATEIAAQLHANRSLMNLLLGDTNDFLKRGGELSQFTSDTAKNSERISRAWNESFVAVKGMGNALASLGWFADTVVQFSRGLTELSQILSGRRNEELKKELTAGFIEPGSPLDTFLSWFGGPKAFRTSSEDSAAPSVAGNVGLTALVKSLENEGYRVTSTTGGTHSGKAHGEGRAVDFVPTSGSVTDAAGRLKAKLASMGIDATVIDASTPDSPSWTGPHVHVQFNNAAAAQRYGELATGASGAAGNVSSTANHNQSTVQIDSVNINGAGKDGRQIGQDFTDHVNRWGRSISFQANSSPN